MFDYLGDKKYDLNFFKSKFAMDYFVKWLETERKDLLMFYPIDVSDIDKEKLLFVQPQDLDFKPLPKGFSTSCKQSEHLNMAYLIQVPLISLVPKSLINSIKQPLLFFKHFSLFLN